MVVDMTDNGIKFTWSIRSLAASSGRVAAAPRLCLRFWSMAIHTLCAVLRFLLVSISQSSEMYSPSSSLDSAKKTIGERYSRFIGITRYIPGKLLLYMGVGFYLLPLQSLDVFVVQWLFEAPNAWPPVALLTEGIEKGNI